MLVVMTRWHEDDLGGRLLADMETGGDAWEVVSLQAMYDGRRPDPMGRQVGEALWPAWEDAEKLERKRRVVGPREWEAQYQQQPAPSEGVIFVTEQIRSYAVHPSPVVSSVRAWDLAATEQTGGRDPDYTVGARLDLLEDGRICVSDIVRLRGTPRDVERAIVETARLDGSDVPIGLPQDPGQAGKSQIAYLVTRLRGFRVVSSVESGTKTTRAMPLASQVEQGNVCTLHRSWRGDLVSEMGSFPSGRYDDQVDACSRAFSMLAKTTGAESMIEFYRLLVEKRDAAGRSADSPQQEEDMELVRVYRDAVLEAAGEGDSILCPCCHTPVTGTRVSDGVDVWHPECHRFGHRPPPARAETPQMEAAA